MNNPKLRSIEDFAQITGVPVSTIRTWRSQGVCPPAIRMGRRLYWREDDILNWIEAKFLAEEERQVSA